MASFNNSSIINDNDNLCWIFDLDGTILDNIPILTRFFTDKIPQHFGKPVIKDDIQTIMKNQIAKTFGGKKAGKLNIIKL